MKKVFFLICVFLLLGNISVSAEEGPKHSRYFGQKICCVLIAPPDMKTDDFINAIDDKLNDIEGTNKKAVDCGTKIQTKYQEFWLNKGELEEGKLTKPIMHEFVKYSGYDKCLFIVPQAAMEKTSVPIGWFAHAEKARASIVTRAFLTDQENILKIINVTKNDDSVASELRAKRGAFEKCMDEVGEQFKTYLHTGK